MPLLLILLIRRASENQALIALWLIVRTQQLEKDLYYYKKTSRDLKKKLRELMSGMLNERPSGIESCAD